MSIEYTLEYFNFLNNSFIIEYILHFLYYSFDVLATKELVFYNFIIFIFQKKNLK